MIELMGQKIAANFVKSNTIPIEDESIYAYGFEMVISHILNITVILLIGTVMNMAIECLIFLAAYVPIRRYAGGYHASSYVRCLIWSCMLIVGMLMATQYLSYHVEWFVSLFVMAFAGILIDKTGPVEDSNKPLEKCEIAVYKQKLKLVLAVEFIITVVLCIGGLHKMAFVVCFSWVTMLGMSLAGVVKNRST